VQLGVTLCSLALGWIGEPLASAMVLSWLGALPHAHLYAHVAAVGAVAVGFALITYFQVVVGELVPKSLALRRAEALAAAVAPSMLLFITLARPAVRFLKVSAATVLRGFDIPMTERGGIHSAEEIKLIATAARRVGMLPEFQEQLIHRAIEIEEIPVREIMTPRQKIFSLPSNMPVEEASGRIIDQLHSRVPVYDAARGSEHIIGVVYSKDLARLMYFRPRTFAAAPTLLGSQSALSAGLSRSTGVYRGAESTAREASITRPPARLAAAVAELRLSQIMKEVLVVPETKPVLDLIREFQQRRRHLAIVVDEFGSTVGLVTAEDAIEQLTGELEDEFDDPTRPLIAAPVGPFVLDGSVSLRDLETQMQWTLPRDGGVETLAGFVLMRLGRIPKGGETVDFEGRRLTVLEMDGRRISRIRVEPIEESAAAKNDSSV
jgi:CBS domain containing-hemolysin-like protein